MKKLIIILTMLTILINNANSQSRNSEVHKTLEYTFASISITGFASTAFGNPVGPIIGLGGFIGLAVTRSHYIVKYYFNKPQHLKKQKCVNNITK